MTGWLLAAALIYVSVTLTPFAWIPTAVVLYWKIGRHYYLKGSKWRRVHFPFMRQYARMAGFVAGLGQKGGGEFDVRLAILKTLQSRYPQTPKEELQAFMDGSIELGRSFVLRRDFAEYVKEKNSKASHAELEAALNKMAEKFANADNTVTVRLVVLRLIEREHGRRAALD